MSSDWGASPAKARTAPSSPPVTAGAAACRRVTIVATIRSTPKNPPAVSCASETPSVKTTTASPGASRRRLTGKSETSINPSTRPPSAAQRPGRSGRGHEHGRVVAGERERQLAARQVEDADHRRHEHPGVVLAAQAAVHAAEERPGVGFPRGLRLEDGLRAGHEQRGADALARHVPDEEEDPRAVAEVVEEIAAHRARRDERRPELVALAGAARRRLRQHVGLDAPRDPELALEALLRGRRLLQVADVLLERVAHVVERARERPHLVARLDRRQRRVEVAAGDRVRARGERRERPREPA